MRALSLWTLLGLAFVPKANFRKTDDSSRETRKTFLVNVSRPALSVRQPFVARSLSQLALLLGRSAPASLPLCSSPFRLALLPLASRLPLPRVLL